MTSEKATFAAGCFWGVEAEFRMVPGVLPTQVGYTGGVTPNPSYEDVCSHTTGHAEAVEVEFDPAKVSYEQLVELFWKIHNPTQVNRQGWDIGDQYRSAIFTHSDEQARIATDSRARAQEHFRKRIATQIEPAGTFYRAEEYHQQYLEKRRRASCVIPAPATEASSTAREASWPSG
ncbi:MAG: peptide-methionine (S)-S-oxide reductase MsrA [Actinomycetota bacterium]